jgi:hypothetical protein
MSDTNQEIEPSTGETSPANDNGSLRHYVRSCEKPHHTTNNWFSHIVEKVDETKSEDKPSRVKADPSIGQLSNFTFYDAV